MARPGVHLFDGPLCRLESWRVDGHGLHLTLSRTSYKVFLGTNGRNAHLAASLGAQAMANAVGTSAAVLSSDGFLVFGERGPHVALYPDCAHPFGGCLEPSDGLDVVEDMARELREELGLGAADLVDLRCLALGGDLALGQPELTFLAVTKLTRAELERRVDHEEHRGSWAMRANAEDIALALREDRAMTPLTRLTLLVYGGHAFGATWLSRACTWGGAGESIGE